MSDRIVNVPLVLALTLGSACTTDAMCSAEDGTCGSPQPACSVDGASCGEGGTCAAGACLRTIVGTMQLVHLTAGGPLQGGPVDLSATTVRAYSCADAGCVEHPGAGRADGTFEIPGVPVGRFWLEVDGPFPERTLEDHESTAVDLTRFAWGRPELVTPAPGTSVAWTLDGLAPWVPEASRIELVSPTCEYADLWLGMTYPGPSGGDVAVSFDLTPRVLVDGARGDRVMVSQLERAGDAELPYWRVVRAGEVPATFAMLDGVAQEAHAALAPVPEASLALAWSLLDFQALAPETPGGASVGPARHTLRVIARPHDAWIPFNAPTLLELPERWDARPDVLTASLVYGDAFPPTWTKTAIARTEWSVAVEFPFPEPEWRTVTLRLESSRGVDASGAVSVSPAVGPVRSPRLANRDALTAQVEVGLTPQLSWSTPAVGPGPRYEVSIWLVPGAGQQQRRVAFLETTETAIHVPPGVLEQGQVYFAVIVARRSEGYAWLMTAPFVP